MAAEVHEVAGAVGPALDPGVAPGDPHVVEEDVEAGDPADVELVPLDGEEPAGPAAPHELEDGDERSGIGHGCSG